MKKSKYPYVVNRLRFLNEHGISKCLLGGCQIALALVELLGILVVKTTRFVMKRKTVTAYLVAKKIVPETPKIGPVFVTMATHPHKRSDTRLPEWREIESPSRIGERDAV